MTFDKDQNGTGANTLSCGIQPQESTMGRQFKKREFTIDDDRLIVSQSKGEFTVHRLERVLRASREALMRRASELGVKLHIKQHNRTQVRKHEPPRPEDAQGNPYNVGKDLLLSSLLKSAERHYDELVPGNVGYILKAGARNDNFGQAQGEQSASAVREETDTAEDQSQTGG